MIMTTVRESYTAKPKSKTVRDGFPELIPYWNTEANDKNNVTLDNVSSSARIVVHLKCPNCGREYTRALNDAYSAHKTNGSTFDGYCAACRPHKIRIYEEGFNKPKSKNYEFLGFYPALVPFFDVKKNAYSKMPEDKRFIKIHVDKQYVWDYRGTQMLTIGEMVSLVKKNRRTNRETVC